MNLLLTGQSSVNRWECDENDHLNVRFYLQRAEQAMRLALAQWGIAPMSAQERWFEAISCHHIRYLREARLAAPLSAFVGVTHFSGTALSILIELRHTGSKQVLCSLLTALRLNAAQTAAVAAAQLEIVPVPDHAGSRGVAAQQTPYAKLDRDGAVAHGYLRIGAGVIAATECWSGGRLADWQLIGRLSDGMPNFWAITQSSDPAEEFLGGAVLEYRVEPIQPLRSGQGYEHFVAVGAIGTKTYEISHLVFDAVTGAITATGDAIAVAMDLSTRKSLAVSPERRARMEQLQRKALHAEH